MSRINYRRTANRVSYALDVPTAPDALDTARAKHAARLATHDCCRAHGTICPSCREDAYRARAFKRQIAACDWAMVVLLALGALAAVLI